MSTVTAEFPGRYDNTSGITIGEYPWRRRCYVCLPGITRTYTVDSPGVMYQNGDEHLDLMGLSGAHSFQHGKKRMHLKPVYHHKYDVRGVLKIASPNTFMTSNEGSCGGMLVYSNVEYGRAYTNVSKFVHAAYNVDPQRNRYNLKPYAVYTTIEAGVYNDPPSFREWAKRLIDASSLNYYATDTNGTLWRHSTSVPLQIRWGWRAELNAMFAEHSLSASAVVDFYEQKWRSYVAKEFADLNGAGRVTTSIPSDLPSESFIRSLIASMGHQGPVSDESFFHSVKWNELAYDAYSDIGYIDNNGLSYLKEAAGLREFAVSSFRTLSSLAFSKGKRRAKALASTYLGAHYGWRLTLLDTAQYVRELRKNRQFDLIQRCSSTTSLSSNDWKITARYQTYYSQRDVVDNVITEKINHFLVLTDTIPSPENIWDAVPWSFVVDWFADVGDTLTSIGNLATLRAYYRILGSTRTVKAVRELTGTTRLDQYGYFDGSLREVIFERKVDAQALAPVPSFGTHKPSQPFNHWVEGAALVVDKLL